MFIEEDNGLNTYIKKSSIEGYGLFANKEFKQGEIVIDYNPFIKSFYKIRYVDLKPEQYNKNWLKPINEEYCLTNDKTNKLHFINHSRNPNCNWLVNDLLIVANKDIGKDEEFFIDYRLEPRPNRLKFPDWI